MATADFLLTLKAHWNDAIDADFTALAHGHQCAPRLANSGSDWITWPILGGRGAGKTRAGAQWVRAIAASDPQARIALIGETELEACEVMVEGVSGLLTVHALGERPL
jgi:phage terminase large subunit-like protein